MAVNISPGVYTTIIDMSQYVAQVPSTIGCLCGVSEKGPDNVLTFVGSRTDLINKFGEPNYTEFGPVLGQAMYEAYNYLGESGSFFFMRCLPEPDLGEESASYANMRIDCDYTYEPETALDSTSTPILAASDATAAMQISFISQAGADSLAGIKTAMMVLTGTINPVVAFYGLGRGQFYNVISIRITEYANPLSYGLYVLDIYERQTDGLDVIVESYTVSLEQTAVDYSGNSLYLPVVLENFSTRLRADIALPSGAQSVGWDYVGKVYAQNLGTVEVDLDTAEASLEDNKMDFTSWATTPGVGTVASYGVIVKDGRGYTIEGWVGELVGSLNESVAIYSDRELTTRGWIADSQTLSRFSTNSDITYQVKKSFAKLSDAFTSDSPVPLRNGSDGGMRNADGSINSTYMTDNVLAKAYEGILINPQTSALADEITDTEVTYFTLVYDAGYPYDVKYSIVALAQARGDCVAILDNGDNATYAASITSREDTNIFNTYYAALYEEYNKVFDIFTGQDIWVSPLYHMSYIIPRSDRVSEIWYAPAGFNRAAIESIKELRFNPKLGERDQMYMRQLNPIVKFREGYVVWGQLTTQVRASALQDVNIVRLVLYCKVALERYCRGFIFEQNDAVTWGQVSADIVAFLEAVKRRRGLYSFAVDVGATEYEIKTKTFHVNVTLQPTRTVEKIELNFYVK